MTDFPNDAAMGARLAAALRQIYDRPQPARPWVHGGNLPWDDPAFSERMLKEHLDQSHGAASRPRLEIRAQVEAMTAWLHLEPGQRLFDVTCGPGLYAAEFARNGLTVSGIDFSPASVRYAREHCVGLACEFTQGDVRQMNYDNQNFDAAIYIYGQFTVLQPAESLDVLGRVCRALRPGGHVLLEVLNDDRFDKKNSNWWYTDQGGLWGDFPYLHLGERTWDEDQRAAVERFYILNLLTGETQSYGLSDQAYTVAQMTDIIHAAGFNAVEVRPAWDGLAMKDAGEWMVYVGIK
jgi:SAM-dependent methyltransferase